MKCQTAKEDATDAETIGAVTKANMRFVPTKTAEQQSGLVLHCMPREILNGVLGCLNGACPDDFSCWFRFEYGRLFRKGIDPLTFFRRGLLDDDEFCEAGKPKTPLFFSSLWPTLMEKLRGRL